MTTAQLEPWLEERRQTPNHRMRAPVMSGATAPGPGPGLPEGSTPCSRSAGHSPGSPGMGRTQSRFGGLWPRWPGPRQEGTSPDGRPPGRLTPRDLQRAFSPVPKPQERDRLKHAGGIGGVQAVKAARNGEDGPKRVWKPVTRSTMGAERHGRGGWSSRQPGVGCRAGGIGPVAAHRRLGLTAPRPNPGEPQGRHAPGRDKGRCSGK